MSEESTKMENQRENNFLTLFPNETSSQTGKMMLATSLLAQNEQQIYTCS